MKSENSKGAPAFVRLDLTREQQAQVRESVGIEAEAIELSATELEERIAPAFTIKVNKATPA